ncbi:hypothetical protein HC256_004218 [Beauveria bassiana]|nr:hypothetical protein HC256_004218 [Beauveria bassiana]
MPSESIQPFTIEPWRKRTETEADGKVNEDLLAGGNEVVATSSSVRNDVADIGEVIQCSNKAQQGVRRETSSFSRDSGAEQSLIREGWRSWHTYYGNKQGYTKHAMVTMYLLIKPAFCYLRAGLALAGDHNVVLLAQVRDDGRRAA